MFIFGGLTGCAFLQSGIATARIREEVWRDRHRKGLRRAVRVKPIIAADTFQNRP